MERVRFCPHCGKLLEFEWRHCPWCGDSPDKEALSWDDMVEGSMDQTEKVAIAGKFRILDELSDKLDDLESELDAFLAHRH